MATNVNQNAVHNSESTVIGGACACMYVYVTVGVCVTKRRLVLLMMHVMTHSSRVTRQQLVRRREKRRITRARDECAMRVQVHAHVYVCVCVCVHAKKKLLFLQMLNDMKWEL